MKRALVFGYGKTGKALIKFLKSENYKVDLYSDLKEDYDSLYDPKVKYDLYVKSPGISYEHKLIKEIEKKHTVLDEIEFTYKYLNSKIVSITGTNGKSTTTTLIYEILKEELRASIGGNIGIPVIEYANNSKDEILVLELSSFQLEKVYDFHSDISVILNITPDHLNRHITMDNYIDAKLNIIKNKRDEDILIYNYDDEILKNKLKDIKNTFTFSRKTKETDIYLFDNYIYYKNEKYLDVSLVSLKGNHNIENVMASILVCKKLNIKDKNIKNKLKNFKSLFHRYEVLGCKNGIRFINDSKATNPNSTLPALGSINRPTVLILGGMEKGSDFKEMIDLIKKKVESVIVFGETKNRLYNELIENSFKNVYKKENLLESFNKALDISKEGYDILLSPACASWDMYKSFEERGDEFKELFGRINV